MSKKFQIALVAALFGLIGWILWIAVHYPRPLTFINRNQHSCQQVLPANLKIVYSDIEKEYAVMVNTNNTWMYAWCRRGYWWDESYEPYTVAYDSCIAKAIAWDYISTKEREYLKKHSYK